MSVPPRWSRKPHLFERFFKSWKPIHIQYHFSFHFQIFVPHAEDEFILSNSILYRTVEFKWNHFFSFHFYFANHFHYINGSKNSVNGVALSWICATDGLLKTYWLSNIKIVGYWKWTDNQNSKCMILFRKSSSDLYGAIWEISATFSDSSAMTFRHCKGLKWTSLFISLDAFQSFFTKIEWESVFSITG